MILLHCNFRIDKKYYAITKPLFERLNNKLKKKFTHFLLVIKK